MNAKKTFSHRILLVGAVVAVCGAAQAQTWKQDVWQDKTGSGRQASSTDWEQRVLKQPQQFRQVNSERWVSPRQSAEPSNVAQGVSAEELATMPFEPPAKTRTRAKWVGNAEVIPPGIPLAEPIPSGDNFSFDDGGVNDCGSMCFDEPCNPCEGPACGECCDFGYELFDGRCHRWLRDISIFVGANAFKGPVDHGVNGNFGFNEGLNLTGPLGDPWGIGYQVGVNWIQSNFSGAPSFVEGNNLYEAPFRRQTFVTAGLFRRADPCRGFQWGVAFDYFRDDYYTLVDLKQLRTDLGYVFCDSYEVGFYGAYGLDSEQTADGLIEPIDMFTVYGRRYFENGGEGRIWGGVTGRGDGLVGADLWLPLGRGFALENRINYMLPKQGRGETAQSREAWGLTIQLIWYPGQNAKCMKSNPFRAMFDVADNAIFMLDRVQ